MLQPQASRYLRGGSAPRVFDRWSDSCTKYCRRTDPLAAAICADCKGYVKVGDFCDWIGSFVPLAKLGSGQGMNDLKRGEQNEYPVLGDEVVAVLRPLS